MNNSLCPECGIAFHCAAKDGKEKCWCFDAKVGRERDPNATDCLCKECLARLHSKWFGWYVWGGILIFCGLSWAITIMLVVRLFHK